MTPRISVIIPTYQHAPTIGACLDSVFAQTVPPTEVIVVNDGSTDGTEAALAPYMSRITLINQANRGSNPARNAGAAKATGDFVIFCDADVRMQPDMLEKLTAALDTHPEASFAYSGFRYSWKRMGSFAYDADKLRTHNFIHTTALIRREHFPGFDEKVKRLQDWDVWLTMLSQGHTGVWVPEELFSIADVRGRQGISQWIPSILLRLPWKRIGWMPASVKKYVDAREVIVAKHSL